MNIALQQEWVMVPVIFNVYVITLCLNGRFEIYFIGLWCQFIFFLLFFFFFFFGYSAVGQVLCLSTPLNCVSILSHWEKAVEIKLMYACICGCRLSIACASAQPVWALPILYARSWRYVLYIEKDNISLCDILPYTIQFRDNFFTSSDLGRGANWRPVFSVYDHSSKMLTSVTVIPCHHCYIVSQKSSDL